MSFNPRYWQITTLLSFSKTAALFALTQYCITPQSECRPWFGG
jgi:hypothetical protein